MPGTRVPPFSVYLFDIDGTLLDTAEDFCYAIQQVLSATPRNDVSNDLIRTYIGRPVGDLFANLFPDYSREQIWDLIQQYRKAYWSRDHPSTHCYDGTAEVLAHLAGKKSTATTKATATARAILERFGLLPYFDHVQGTDGFPAKPHPDVLFRALNELGEKAENCLLVGDSCIDIEAARRAGVKCCSVTYGYGKPVDLAALNPDYMINHLRDLLP